MFRNLWMLDYYPWFVMFPPSYHCIMVCFPKFFLNNYLYGIALTCFTIFPLYYEPFVRSNRNYRALFCVFPLIVIPISFMGTMDCNA